MINFYSICNVELSMSHLREDLEILIKDGIQEGTYYESLLHIIKREVVSAYYYAKYTKKERWLEAEPFILQNLEYTFLYALYVVKGRWLEAEPLILTDPAHSYWYARDVIRGRWKEAEDIIKRNDYASAGYQRRILNGREYD